MKKNYQITIGYRAVISVNVKAENEAEAKKLGIEKFKGVKDKIFKKDVELQDDNFKADGCIDMDATWYMYDK